MSKQYLLMEFLRDNPTASNKDISEMFDISTDYAKSMVSKLNKAGVLDIKRDASGERIIRIKSGNIYDKRKEKLEHSKEERERVKNMLKIASEVVLNGMMSTNDVDKIISAGNLLIRCIDRM